MDGSPVQLLTCSDILFPGGLSIHTGNDFPMYPTANIRPPAVRPGLYQSVVIVAALFAVIVFAVAVRALGLAAVPIFGAMLAAVAVAIGMSLRNRSLSRQLRAVEVLGRACAAGVREE